MNEAASENLKKRNKSSATGHENGDRKPLLEADSAELNNSKPKYNHSKSNASASTAAYNNNDDDESDYDYDEQLPYGGKVYLARRKKPDTWLCIAIQVLLVVFVVVLCYYSYYYFDHMHVSVIKAYAHLGFHTAQHELGNRYLHGVGVEKHEEKAMEWFKKAADQGHPHASYNLAIGHLKGLKSNINHTEARRLIEHAAKHDVHEAKQTLHHICNTGGCE